MASQPNPFAEQCASTFTAEPYFGRRLSLRECGDVLARFSLESVAGRLALLKTINDLVFSDPDATDESLRPHVARTVTFLFGAKRAEAAMGEAIREKNFRPVSDQALLATLELAVRCCRRDPDHFVNTEEEKEALTHVLLSFQSVLFSGKFQIGLEGKTSFESLGPEAWAEFLRNRMAHNTHHYYRHVLGRLYTICCSTEIDRMVKERCQGRGVGSFFQEYFGLSPEDYFACASVVVSPAFQLDPDKADGQALFFREGTYWQIIEPAQRPKLERFIRMASRPVGEATGVPAGEIDEFLFNANAAHVAPLLNFGSFTLAVSPHLMLNKFVRGLPYLAQEARQLALGRKLTDDEVKECRGAFGVLFECYIAWLFQNLLAGWTRTEVINGVWCGPVHTDGECDHVIVRRDMAFVLESKTTMATIAFRSTGSFSSMDAMLEPGARQAYRAARALREGRAVRAKDGTAIEGIRFVVPCVVTYDTIPLFHPVSEFYEKHLQQKTGLKLFRAEDGIEPLQFFTVDFLESWEDSFDLSPESGAPFGYLLQRARVSELRHKSVQRGVVSDRRPEAPSPFDEMAVASKDFLRREARKWMKATS